MFGSALHQAGYDSLLTARVFVSLSTKISLGASYKAPTSVIKGNEQYPSLPDGGIPLATAGYVLPTEVGPVDVNGAECDEISLPPSSGGFRPTLKDASSMKANWSTLDHLSLGVSGPLLVSPSGKFERTKENNDRPHINTSTSNQARAPNHTLTSNLIIPPFNSAFWKVYGNKLRLYGTVEGVCSLTDVEKGA